MRAALLAIAALAGCANGTMIVRDAYVTGDYLVVEKCFVKANSDRLSVGECHEEHKLLPKRVVRVEVPVPAPAAAPATVTTPAKAAIEAAKPEVARPEVAAEREVELVAPVAQVADVERPASNGQTPPAGGRSGFSRLRDEVIACGAQHRMIGVVNVMLELRDGVVRVARTKEGQGAFEHCVETHLVGIALPQSQANRTLTVPFALRAR